MAAPTLQPIIERLTEWRTAVIAQLRAGDQTALGLKLALDAAIHWLKVCDRHQIPPGSQVMPLPPPEDYEPLGFYRIIWDGETEDREVAQARPGDLLVRRP